MFLNVMLSRCITSSEVGDVDVLRILGDGEPFTNATFADIDIETSHDIVAVGNSFNFDLESKRKIEFEPLITHALTAA